jgi:hypothetical protein
MTTPAQNPQKVGGSFFLTIPPVMRDGLNGGEPMHWTKARPRSYAIAGPVNDQGSNSRTLMQGRTLKIRIPREAITENGPDRPWTIRQEDGRLIAEAAEEGQAQPIKLGDVVETEEGPAVVVRAARSGDGRTLCAYLMHSTGDGSGLKIEAGDRQGYTVDLTRFIVVTPTPDNRKGTLDKATLKAIAEVLAPLF